MTRSPELLTRRGRSSAFGGPGLLFLRLYLWRRCASSLQASLRQADLDLGYGQQEISSSSPRASTRVLADGYMTPQIRTTNWCRMSGAKGCVYRQRRESGGLVLSGRKASFEVQERGGKPEHITQSQRKEKYEEGVFIVLDL